MLKCAECGADTDAAFCPDCGAFIEDPAQITMAENDPQRVLHKRYIVLSLLGRGGMGAVYVAKDTQLGKIVAVKVLPAEIACDLRAIDWMKEEVRIAQDMRHENIAAIYNFEADKEKQSCFIVMEFINGVDLHALLARSEDERLPLQAVAHVLSECSKAFSYAHSKRVIHRDIKPKNIMLTREGVVKVTDFGIARRLQETMSKISQTMIAGTPAYMAPEHIMGRKIDARADIYSLGATVYELLSGNPPFHKGQIDIQILQKEVPPLELELFGGNAELADKVNAVLFKCLAKEPAERYTTATEFYEAFCQAAGIEPEAESGVSEQTLSTMTKAITAALVDQQSMLAKTETPIAQTPPSALEPTELTPPMPSSKPKRSGALVIAAIIILAIIALAVGVPLFWPGGQDRPALPQQQEDPVRTVEPAAPAEEGTPKLAIAEFIVEGDPGTNTAMSLANIIVYRSKKFIKERYRIIEPLELKGILESLGMKVAQLTDYQASKRLYTERGIRYLILCTLVKGADFDLRGRMIDLKDGRVMQQEKPFVRHSGDIRYRVELLGDVLTLDDTHKKIYYLLDEARLARSDGKYEEAMAKFAEALKLDPKDETIPQAKIDFTERLAKDALNKADWRTYDKAYELFEAAKKYNFSPETVKKLPEELVLVLLKEGDQDLDRKNYEKALKAFRCAAKVKDDPIIKDKIKQTEKLMQDTIEEPPGGKSGKGGKGYYEEDPYGKGGKGGK